jgi:hypothetical protein
MEAQAGVQSGGNHRPAVPPPGTRSSTEIRRDIVRQRKQLSASVEMLRTRWGEVTDVRRQVREHRTELLVGAAVVGFVVGGVIALSRRRRG